MTIALARHRKIDFSRFEAHIRKLDEVIECITTGGGMDYVLKIISPSLAAFQDLVEFLLAAELGIQRYMNYMVTRSVKSAQRDLAGLSARAGKPAGAD